jgi:preprotein translocase subunit SecF
MTRVRSPAGAFTIKMEEQIDNKPKKNWHDRNYKLLLLIPATLILLSFVYMGVFYSQNGDFIHKDISLTGGTSITIYEDIDTQDLINSISGQLDDLSTREISDLVTRERVALIIETKSSVDLTKEVVEDYLGHELTEENSSIEFTGSSLSESFYRQLLIAILVAFIFMAIVVFIIFRTIVPSAAVIISAFADILMTLILVNILGMKMSTAGIVAFLMLIGYSVDTDILLTTRILKRREGNLNKRLIEASKTGLTMTLTSLLAMSLALIVVKSFSPILTQIFTIIVIGLGFDILNTWITTVSILKWYAKSKGME